MSATEAEEIRSAFEALLPQALEWLKRMVEINSFTRNKDGVNRLGHLTAEAFSELGFVAEFVESEHEAYGRHVFLTRGPEGEKPLLLVSHLDTVFPPEEERRQGFGWAPAPSEKRIYGPGTVDIKGGTILMWMMLWVLRQRDASWFERTRWMVALNASEEVMQQDFSWRLAERCPGGAQAVLVFEGGPKGGKTQYHVVTSRKGRAEYRIDAKGRGAHAGSCHAEGVNAVVGLAAVIQEVAALTDYARGVTVNVGRVEGGTVSNRVPQEAHVELELRAFDLQVFEEVRAKIEGLAQRRDVLEGLRLEVACLAVSPAWAGGETNEALVLAWQRAAAQMGLEVCAVSRGGLSDANYAHVLGPTLDGLGPSGGNAHCSERSQDGSKVPEYVEPDSLVEKGTLNVLGLLESVGR